MEQQIASSQAERVREALEKASSIAELAVHDHYERAVERPVSPSPFGRTAMEAAAAPAPTLAPRLEGFSDEEKKDYVAQIGRLMVPFRREAQEKGLPVARTPGEEALVHKDVAIAA